VIVPSLARVVEAGWTVLLPAAAVVIVWLCGRAARAWQRLSVRDPGRPAAPVPYGASADARHNDDQIVPLQLLLRVPDQPDADAVMLAEMAGRELPRIPEQAPRGSVPSV